MLKKTITYTDYNNNERTEDFYFHLNKAELLEMELSVDGGMTTKVKRIAAAQSAPEMMAIWKDILLKSYGVKSDDGKRFIKNQELRDAFEQSEAYSVLFTELAMDTDAAINFVKGVMPVDISDEQLNAAMAAI